MYTMAMKSLVYSLALIILSTPSMLFAQITENCNPGTNNFPACDIEGSAVSAANAAERANRGLSYTLDSPLDDRIGSIESLLTTILNALLVIAVPIIVFFIIFAGFKYVTARGNPEEIKTATRMLTYAIIGGVLILGGVAIAEIIKGIVESFRN